MGALKGRIYDGREIKVIFVPKDVFENDL